MLNDEVNGPSLDWVRQTYNSELLGSRDKPDLWHEHTHAETERFVSEMLSELSISSTDAVLNAGSSGNGLGITHPFHIQIDIAERSLRGTRNAIAADLQMLPFRSTSFELVVCVGSVINCCDAVRALSELTRVLRPGGVLILEFERSQSLEFVFTPAFGQSSTVINTFYNEKTHPLWVYSDEYVNSILAAFGMKVEKRQYFHVLSPLVLRVTNSVTAARRVANLDPYFRKLPLVAKLACNTIWFCSKKVKA